MLPTREHNWQICIFIYSPLIWHSWILYYALPWILLRWKGGWTFWHEHVLVSHKTRKTVPHRINCLTQHAYVYTDWQMVRWFIHHTLIGQQKDWKKIYRISIESWLEINWHMISIVHWREWKTGVPSKHGIDILISESETAVSFSVVLFVN